MRKMFLYPRTATFLAMGALLLSIGAIAQAQPQGNGTVPREGYTAPPALNGYDPTTDPRDFTGVWRSRRQPGVSLLALAPDLSLNEASTQWLAERMARLEATEGATTIANPHVMCRPTGMNQALAPIAPVYVLQTQQEVVFIVTDEIRNVRHVYLNRQHPENIVPSYSGDSVGHWEGNTLVVDTIGYNGRGALGGIVHSEQMHLVERISKNADGTSLIIDATFEDPQTMTGPVNVKKEWDILRGQQPLEFDCEENPREDNFSGMLFEEEYLRPVCILHESEGMTPSRMECKAP